jgi:hypothetical protein
MGAGCAPDARAPGAVLPSRGRLALSWLAGTIFLKNNAMPTPGLLERIKVWAVQAMFSDDRLLEQLVLKGGNAMALVHQVSARASIDLDFSLKQDFGDELADVEMRIARGLGETFRANGFEVFDFRMAEAPRAISQDMRHFWGGYAVEFKLARADAFAAHSADVEMLRRLALNLGQGTKFLIDISRFEYVDAKQPADFEGYMIYVYSPEMIVCEKLRAICQQLPEYGPIIRRARLGSARARDFVDIFVLMDRLGLDLDSEKTRSILVSMFEVKRVPLSFLGLIPGAFEFHRAGFDAVKDTVSPDFELRPFEHYFSYTMALVERLKPLWDK